MLTFTYDTPKPKPEDFPLDPGTIGDPLALPKPLPEEAPGEWGEPITADVSDDRDQPGEDDDPADAPTEDDGSKVAIDEDEVPPARGPETEPP